MAKGNSKLTKAAGGGNATPKEFKYEEPLLEAGTPTKYSNEVFEERYRKARQLYNQNEKNNVSPDNWSLGTLYKGDEEEKRISLRDAKGVQSLINREKGSIDWDSKHGVITDTEAIKLRTSLNTVQRTINDHYKRYKHFGVW